MDIKEELKKYAPTVAYATTMFVFVQGFISATQYALYGISRPAPAWLINGVVGIVTPALLVFWYKDEYDRMAVALVTYFAVAYFILKMSGIPLAP